MMSGKNNKSPPRNRTATRQRWPISHSIIKCKRNSELSRSASGFCEIAAKSLRIQWDLYGETSTQTSRLGEERSLQYIHPYDNLQVELWVELWVQGRDVVNLSSPLKVCAQGKSEVWGWWNEDTGYKWQLEQRAKQVQWPETDKPQTYGRGSAWVAKRHKRHKRSVLITECALKRASGRCP